MLPRNRGVPSADRSAFQPADGPPRAVRRAAIAAAACGL